MEWQLNPKLKSKPEEPLGLCEGRMTELAKLKNFLNTSVLDGNAMILLLKFFIKLEVYTKIVLKLL